MNNRVAANEPDGKRADESSPGGHSSSEAGGGGRAASADRRREPRLVMDRRGSLRRSTSRRLSWRLKGGRRVREALVIEQSLDGLALIASTTAGLRAEARIIPATPDSARRFGFLRGRIVRTEPGERGSTLAFVEIEC